MNPTMPIWNLPGHTRQIADRDALIAKFESYGRPREGWLVGAEFERAVVRRDGSPVGYDEPSGIRWILETLEATGGWEGVYEGEHLIALKRESGAHITLEPGGQVELSGAPHKTLGALHAEIDENRDALLALAVGHDLHWITCGLTPLAAIEDIGWMPKGRYDVMKAYLPRRGPLAHYMMKGTCSVQANYDFSDEADCARKVRAIAGLAPLTTAIFSNSPLYQNKPTGFMSYRGHIWRHTDPDRTGFPPGLRSAYTHERWVDYLLDVPMMFYVREGDFLPANGRTFRQFMDDGIDGRFPSWTDWALHQTSVFPEVRIKSTIEVRGADAISHDLALAFVALFTGLLYCEHTLDELIQMVSEIERFETHETRFDIGCKHGLAGVIGKRTIGDWAVDLSEMAERGLRHCLPDDVPLLEPLLERIHARRCPALDLLKAWERDSSPENVLRTVAY